ncbi:MAG: hypothetical protein RJA34_2654 [Pseudomonadota bacterium]|jgi:hypothetical protein
MTSIRVKHLRLVVYPNDHPPPHAHVLGPGWEIRIELSLPPALMTVAGKPKTTDVAAALLATAERLAELRTAWSDLHD